MKKRAEIPLKITVSLAMLSAISIVLGKYLAIPGGEVLRFSFENLPIILAGVAFGPVAGALVGTVADLVGCLLVGYTINPLVTLGAVCIGLVSGISYRLLRKSSLPFWLKVAVVVALSHLLGSVVIKTFGLAQWYDMPFIILMLWRLLNYIIVGVLEGILVFALMKNKLISTEIASLTKGYARFGKNEAKGRGSDADA
ncbi:MAG: folate family ECF transporter S component [Clostridia bacterium]|nr:folate family ECF transporter S component [Clostridia bacterium]